jgi:hypothetical protein
MDRRLLFGAIMIRIRFKNADGVKTVSRQAAKTQRFLITAWSQASVILKSGFMLFGLTLLPPFLFAEDGISTNVELAASAVEEAASRIVERFHLDADSTIGFDARGESNIERFVIGKLAARLSERFRLVSNPTDGSPDLAVTVVRADVRYGNPEGKRPWRRVELTRKAEVELLCKVKNGLGQIRAETITGSREDRISDSELESVEQGGLVFGIPDRPKRGLFSRWLEPILAAAVTGTVIYLFFHIRSE